MTVPEQPVRRRPLWKKLAVSVTTLLISYAVAEVILTALYIRGDIEPQAIWVHDIKGRRSAVEFDPVLGYRLDTEPTRMMVVSSNGTIESVGVFRGNNVGAPDEDNFSPRRGDNNRKRYVVFGDSFTSGLYMERNWPEVAETLSEQQGTPVELLNFSIDGGGLANWHRVLTEIIVADDYEIDGVVFAVFGSDLSRPLTFWDQVVPGNNQSMLLGRLSPASPESQPDPRPPSSVGRDRLKPLETWQTVSPQIFDQYLSGDRRPSVSRPFRYYLAAKCRAVFDGFLRRPDESRLLLESLQYFPDAELFFFDRRQMVTQVEQALQKKQVPALVVHIPYREVLLTRAGAGSETTAFYLESVGEVWEAQAFAKLIQADYVDGAEAFKGYGVEEIRACWLPLDGHWNQAGAERFAEFVVPILQRWSERQDHKSAGSGKRSGVDSK